MILCNKNSCDKFNLCEKTFRYNPDNTVWELLPDTKMSDYRGGYTKAVKSESIGWFSLK